METNKQLAIFNPGVFALLVYPSCGADARASLTRLHPGRSESEWVAGIGHRRKRGPFEA